MASIDSDAIEFGPSPLKKQKNEIDEEPRIDGDKDVEMNGDEDAEIDDEDDDEIHGDGADDSGDEEDSEEDEDSDSDDDEESEDDEDSDSEVDSVIDFEGDDDGKTNRDYLDYDSDSDERKRQLVRFHYQWEKSEGFEVDWSNVTYGFGAFPVVWKEILSATKERSDKVVKRLTLYAIDKHNRDEGKRLELVKILKANYHLAKGQVLYITFCAKDLSSSDSEPITYQTKVWKFLDEIEVLLFRPRPTNEEIASVEVIIPCPSLHFPGKPPEFYAEPADLWCFSKYAA